MKNYCLFVALLAAFSFYAQTPGPIPGEEKFTLHYTPSDSAVAAALRPVLNAGVQNAETFFGHPFPQHFDVYIFPERPALDRQWQSDWGDSTFQSACWMVASGVGRRLDLLSPRVWPEQACEHRASDSAHVAQLLAHEIIHVYHGQHHPQPDFNGAEELGWWIEGIATYASGQLNGKRVEALRKLLTSDAEPKQLSQMWSGPQRYGLSGSLAAYIDKVQGRTAVYRLLDAPTTEEILKRMGKSEAELIGAWKQYWIKVKM